MDLFYRLAADLILVLHVGYVAFVLLGFVAILLGLLFRQSWARGFWLRMIHLAMILVVVAETVLGVTCPLTTWENSLRRLAGGETYDGDFIAEWLHDLLFLDGPPWMFTLAYLGFGAAVLLTFLLAPPRLPGKAVEEG